MARHKLERESCANFTRSQRKYPPGMTYEEIASSREPVISKDKAKGNEVISPDRDSLESIEPLEEKDIRATGPDPYDKLNYKTGRQINIFNFFIISLNIFNSIITCINHNALFNNNILCEL